MKPLKYFVIASLLTTATSQAAEKHVHGEGELFIAIENNKVLIELESAAHNILGFEHEPKNKEQEERVEKANKLLGNYQNIIEFKGVQCKQVAANIEAPFDAHDDHDKHDHGKEKHHDEHDHDKHDHGKDKHHDEHDHDKHDHGKDKHHDEHDHDKHDHGKDKHHDEHDHDKHDHGKDKHHDEHDHDKHDHDSHKDEHSDYHASYTLECSGLKTPVEAQITAFDHFGEFESVDVNWVNETGQGSSEATAKSTSVKIGK